MTIQTIVADVSARLENIVSSLFQSKPSQSSPKPDENPKIDTYGEDLRVQLARSAFGENSSNPAQAWAHQSPLLYSPWGLVAIAGCGGDDRHGSPTYYNYPPKDAGNDAKKDAGSDAKDAGGDVKDAGGDIKDAGKPDAKPDAGPPIDNDGDGFKSDVDCDDNDPNTFPLKDYETLNVYKSVTICHGTYNNSSIKIKGVSGLSVKGEGAGVLIQGHNATTAVQAGVIDIENVSNSNVTNFHVVAFGSGYVAYRLKNSNNNSLTNLTHWPSPGGTGISLENCSNNKILNYQIDGNVGFGIYISGGSGNIIDNLFVGGWPDPNAWFPSAVFSASQKTVIQNSNIGNVGLFLASSDQGTVIKNNSLTNPLNPQTLSGIELYGTDATVSQNKIEKFGTGIKVFSTSKNNKIQNNTLTGNKQCIVIDPAATGTVNSGNQCN